MKIRDRFTITRLFLIVLVILIFSSNVAYAGSLGGGIAEGLLTLLIFFLIQIGLIIFWFIMHIPSKNGTVSVLIISSFIDLVAILFTSFSVSLLISLNQSFTGEGINFGVGLWGGIIEQSFPWWFYSSRLLILLFIVILILFFMNKWILVLSKSNRVTIHFLQCILVAIGVLTIFTPNIAGPITRWFVDPATLILKHNDNSYKDGIKWSEFYGFDEETIAYYSFEKILTECSEQDALESLTKLAVKSVLTPVSNAVSPLTLVEPQTQNLSSEAENDYNANDYLILHDIGDYKIAKYKNISSTHNKRITDNYILKIGVTTFESVHLIPDLKDISYMTEYSREKKENSFSFDNSRTNDASKTKRTRRSRFVSGCDNVEVSVIKHTGGESDKWLQHELAGNFIQQKGDIRDIQLENIEGKKVFIKIKYGFGSEDVIYAWLHDNAVFKIKSHREFDCACRPTEILTAYLKKFPPTVRSPNIMKWQNHHVAYELWLSKKWLEQIKDAEPIDDKILKIALKHIFLYLKFREKEYGIKAVTDKKGLWKLYLVKDLTRINKFVVDTEQWLTQAFQK